ncbi:MAG: NUDIX hydrolase [Bacteroidetes bacterium]|nr:NUDIX hydrolase [Bacteroidota bacterium]
MHRAPLLQLLRSHRPSDAHESAMRDRIIAFIGEHTDCFERSLLVGHITGSAMIVNRQRTHTLLTHHGKLDKWLQLGGHSDGDPDTLAVAQREAEEESGLKSIVPVSASIFDVDVHPIPARKTEPEHFHYDIRFLFEADDAEPLIITSESKDLAWIPLAEIERYTTEESMLRMVRKVLQ